MVAFERPAQAYVDPGSGFVFLQVAGSMCAGAVFYLRHRVKRLGCGESSGHGKTSGKGHKGQKARSGGSIRLGPASAGPAVTTEPAWAAGASGSGPRGCAAGAAKSSTGPTPKRYALSTSGPEPSSVTGSIS